MNTAHLQYLYRYLRISQHFDETGPPYLVEHRKAFLKRILDRSNPRYEYLRGYIDGMWVKYEDLIIERKPWLSENPEEGA